MSPLYRFQGACVIETWTRLRLRCRFQSPRLDALSFDSRNEARHREPAKVYMELIDRTLPCRISHALARSAPPLG